MGDRFCEGGAELVDVFGGVVCVEDEPFSVLEEDGLWANVEECGLLQMVHA